VPVKAVAVAINAATMRAMADFMVDWFVFGGWRCVGGGGLLLQRGPENRSSPQPLVYGMY
jgi:hypothetical protein